MAQNVNPTFVKTPNAGVTQITTGTGQNTNTTVYTGGTNGTKVASLIATAQNTSAAFDVRWGVTNAGVTYFLGTSSIPVSAGTASSVPAINLFNSATTPGLTVDSDGNPFIFLPSTGWALVVQTSATSSQWVSSALIQVITMSAGDF